MVKKNLMEKENDNQYKLKKAKALTTGIKVKCFDLEMTEKVKFKMASNIWIQKFYAE